MSKDGGPQKRDPVIYIVCPLCRVHGKNIRFMDLHDPPSNTHLTMVTCLTCRGVYSKEYEGDG